MKIIRRLLGIALLLYSTNNTNAQFASYSYQLQRTYTAIQGGEEIGWLRISMAGNGSEKLIKLESVLFIQMHFSFEAKAHASNRFVGDTLTHALTYRTLNGKVKLDNDLQLKNGVYKAVKGKVEKAIRRLINHTALSLYFSEPVAVTTIFSEVYLSFIPIEKIAASVYLTPLPDGSTITYTYEHGQLVRVLAKSSLGTVVFQLKQ